MEPSKLGDNVKIDVKTNYLSEQSDPDSKRFVAHFVVLHFWQRNTWRPLLAPSITVFIATVCADSHFVQLLYQKVFFFTFGMLGHDVEPTRRAAACGFETEKRRRKCY
jgi:hypothetical protein